VIPARMVSAEKKARSSPTESIAGKTWLAGAF
jgi:hypothetical protein